jgi:hypothetical protein
MTKATIADLEGGAALCTWFERTPSFHDAKLRELELRQGAPSRLIAHTFRMESELDPQGYFLLTIFELIEVELFEFMEAGIMHGLDINIDDDGITLSFDSSYGVHGRIKAKRIVVSFEPKKPE